MSPVNNGRWMLVMFVFASLVVPGIVAASQTATATAEPAETAPSAEPISVDVPELTLAAEPAAAGTCFNRVCTTTAQCRTWCDDPSAKCAPVNLPPHYKFCFLP